MEWTEITSQTDADVLLRAFGHFHDAVIREAHLWTDHWVSADLSMACSEHLDNRIRFLIQRQFQEPAAIELLFEEITHFNLIPSPEGYFSIIFSATLLVQDGLIFWSPVPNWRPDMPERNDTTWISARRLRWRGVEWLGQNLRYGPKEEGL
jgi:chorismate mutase